MYAALGSSSGSSSSDKIAPYLASDRTASQVYPRPLAFRLPEIPADDGSSSVPSPGMSASEGGTFPAASFISAQVSNTSAASNDSTSAPSNGASEGASSSTVDATVVIEPPAATTPKAAPATELPKAVASPNNASSTGKVAARAKSRSVSPAKASPPAKGSPGSRRFSPANTQTPRVSKFRKGEKITDVYSLGAVLGTGGFSTVRLATHKVREAAKSAASRRPARPLRLCGARLISQQFRMWVTSVC